MSIFQNAKDHQIPLNRSLDIRILVKLVHFNFERVFLNVPFKIFCSFQLKNCGLKCQFSKTPKFIKIHLAFR